MSTEVSEYSAENVKWSADKTEESADETEWITLLIETMKGWKTDRMLRKSTTIESSAATEFQRELSDNFHLE